MIRAWLADAAGAHAVSPGEAVERAARGDGMVWIDMDGGDERLATELLAPLALHPLAIEDMVQEVNRPKVDDYRSYLVVVVHSARWEPGQRPTLRELDILVGERFLLTYHDGSTRSVAAAHEVLPRRPDLLARGPAHLLHFVLDLLVDHYLPIMDQIAAEVDAVEDEAVHDGGRGVNERILRLKRGMSALRRIVGPQRDTILVLTRDEFPAIPPEVRPYLRDVYDRLARVSDLLDTFRDEVTTLLDLNMAMISNRINEVSRILTVIATIMLPLTVVTGFYGMNFRLAEFDWPHGEWYAVALLVATAAGTWWFLRRRRLF